MKPPSRQLYVENHRAHEVMLGCQQSVQGNSGIIIGALAIAADHFVKWLAIWQICMENSQWPAIIFNLSSRNSNTNYLIVVVGTPP